MREEIVNLDNNISIHISRSDVPPLDEGVTVEYRRRMLSDMHLHNEYEFLRVDRGIFRCVTLDGEFLLREGDIIFINKYVPHSTFEETNDTHSTLIQFRLPSDGDSITRYISRFTSISDTPACVFKKERPNLKRYGTALIPFLTNTRRRSRTGAIIFTTTCVCFSLRFEDRALFPTRYRKSARISTRSVPCLNI